ncbi:M16 family metallopeptidase [Paenibacillus sp. OAS669]|uniref:M16 family metallopeptidase n=1 Tax=Paenibacillus sp. OAS669 TaxID=2663821 RepID=UPI00178BBE40|nr:pitrilysin family protein [Paenibacillus sp. OAS669]MBE1446200.1 putative Zn-dependent peptidase [Paenibacillus sp. OAS669]
MQKTTLANGLTIVSKHNEQAVSTLICYWVRAGGHYEKQYPYGIAHFLEHMLFKGTKGRTKEQITNDIENYGGRMNAATSVDRTRYYAHVPFDKWRQGVELLTDMVFHSEFPEEELQLEKKVVIEEIKRAHDNPRDHGSRTLLRMLRAMHPERAGNLGTEETLTAMTREDLIKYHRHYYKASNIVLVVTGNIEHDKLVEYIGSLDIPASEPFTEPLDKLQPYQLGGRVIHEARDIRQAHLHWGMYGPSSYEDDKYAGYVALHLLGGGHGSRLKRRIRGEMGLAYEVWAAISPMVSEGFITGYVGTDPLRLEDAKNVILEELERMHHERISDEELERAQNAIIGRHMISQDQTEAVNSRLASEQLYRIQTDPHYFAAQIRSVTPEDVMAFARSYLRKDQMLFVQVSRAEEAGQDEGHKAV